MGSYEETEVPLVGGISLRGIVRVGDTVRRPLKPDSDFIHELLEYFEAVGFEGAPRFRGIDSKNREIVTYIRGSTLPHNGFRLSEDGVRAGARLVRAVHDLPRAHALLPARRSLATPTSPSPTSSFAT
jgi:hypothetical protein